MFKIIVIELQLKSKESKVGSIGFKEVKDVTKEKKSAQNHSLPIRSVLEHLFRSLAACWPHLGH